MEAVRIDMPTLTKDPPPIPLTERLHNFQTNPHEKDPPTIFRIPSSVRESNKLYYEPQMVSIGPYYHGKESLRAMEDNKVRYLHDFLAHFPSVTMEDLLDKIRALETQARRCYSDSVPHLESDQFVEMLLLDGCFILEQCHKWVNKKPDVLSNVSWIEPTIVCDLLLMENQIPFFVLKMLHKTCNASTGSLGDRQSLLNTLKCILNYRPLFGIKSSRSDLPSCEIHHLLHFYHEFYVPKSCTTNIERKLTPTLLWSKTWHLLFSFIFWFLPRPNHEENISTVPCATDLRESGVLFQKKTNPVNLFDITFFNGILEIPSFEISISQKKIVSNILAFDGTNRSNLSLPLCRYLAFLYHLIDTTEDVKLLEQCGIMNNVDPRLEETTAFLNHLENLNFWDPKANHFADLFSDIQKYQKTTWHWYRAKLKRDYFGNPWSIISLVAGSVLLVLTFVQTFYTIHPAK